MQNYKHSTEALDKIGTLYAVWNGATWVFWSKNITCNLQPKTYDVVLASPEGISDRDIIKQIVCEHMQSIVYNKALFRTLGPISLTCLTYRGHSKLRHRRQLHPLPLSSHFCEVMIVLVHTYVLSALMSAYNDYFQHTISKTHRIFLLIVNCISCSSHSFLNFSNTPCNSRDKTLQGSMYCRPYWLMCCHLHKSTHPFFQLSDVIPCTYLKKTHPSQVAACNKHEQFNDKQKPEIV